MCLPCPMARRETCHNPLHRVCRGATPLTGARPTRYLSHSRGLLLDTFAHHAPPHARADVRTLVGTFENGSLDDLVGKADFKADEQHLADTLVATKLVSDSADTDARGLAGAAQGYDAIRRAAEGADPVALRPLQMP